MSDSVSLTQEFFNYIHMLSLYDDSEGDTKIKVREDIDRQWNRLNDEMKKAIIFIEEEVGVYR